MLESKTRPKPPLARFDDLSDEALVRASSLIHLKNRPGAAVPLPFSPSTLRRLVKSGAFPKPLHLPGRQVVWRVKDVRAWLKAQGGAQ